MEMLNQPAVSKEKLSHLRSRSICSYSRTLTLSQGVWMLMVQGHRSSREKALRWDATCADLA